MGEEGNKEGVVDAVVAVVPPPPGAEEGGKWGSEKYIGDTTKMYACLGCLCCGVPGCLVLLCPQDERKVYTVGGVFYDTKGMKLEGGSNFTPDPPAAVVKMERE